MLIAAVQAVPRQKLGTRRKGRHILMATNGAVAGVVPWTAEFNNPDTLLFVNPSMASAKANI